MGSVGGQADTDGIGTDGMNSKSMTSRLSYCGESALEMLAQNEAVLTWCGDSETTTVRSIVGAVGGVISMLQMVDSADVNTICICNNRPTPSCS